MSPLIPASGSSSQVKLTLMAFFVGSYYAPGDLIGG